MTATFEAQTPHGVRGGALACTLLRGDVDAALGELNIQPVGSGAARVRSLAGVDEGVVARISPDAALLMPHAGSAVSRALLAALQGAGLRPSDAASWAADPMARYPEAADLVEACMLDALAQAASPLAIDLLLDQPRRWREREGAALSSEAIDDHSRVLNRLLTPPLVAAVGPSNIGKSTLLNALARREVAIVADEPGVTRDHVGALLDLGGLVVRWIDTPGVRETSDPIERAAQREALAAAAGADLVISCADAGAPFLPEASLPAGAAERALRLGLRADLGAAAGAELRVCAATGDGIDALVSAVRESLVPAAALARTGPWRFHPALRA